MKYLQKQLTMLLTEASIKLGTTSDKLEYEVIDKGSNGFLGIGSRDAVIKVKKAEASVEDEIREFLDSVFKAMKLEVTIDIKVDEDNRNVDVELNGPEMGVLIGKRGQTLDSLQYLTNLAINKQSDEYTTELRLILRITEREEERHLRILPRIFHSRLSVQRDLFLLSR